jgi:CheY-like chemotaxis protein/HPt (histidine-containing phosphotransfer) domain-containing protein
LHDALVAAVTGRKVVAPREAPTHGLALAPRSAQARILIVEDNITNQQVVQGMLKKLGFHAEVAANGIEAVEALETLDFDLVLMDGQMPEMDGFQAARIIRDPHSRVRNHQVPVIAMTALAMKGDKEKCLQAGMDDYLSKPIELKTLVECLDKWLTGKGPLPAKSVQPGKASEAPGVPAGAAAFDRSMLMQRVMNDEALVFLVLEAFLGDMPGQIVTLKACAGAGDSKGVEQQAHKIKGACGSVGGEALRLLAESLEQAGRAGDTGFVSARLAKLDQAFGELEAAIRLELGSSLGSQNSG